MEAIRNNIAATLHEPGFIPFPYPLRSASSSSTKRVRSERRRSAIRRARDIACDVVAETLWPTRCAICDKPGEVLCNECSERIGYIDTLTSCPRCGSPYGSIQCSECNDVSMGAIGLDSFPLDSIASAVHIDDDTKRIITLFKDHDEHRLAPIIARIMCRYINPAWLGSWNERDETGITFIPATADALRRRGFDHMEEIAKIMCSYTGFKLYKVFERPKNKDQRKLGRKQRAQNMSEQFRILPNAMIAPNMILIDDISTTGSTLFGAALAMRSSGVERIYGLTFGKVC